MHIYLHKSRYLQADNELISLMDKDIIIDDSYTDYCVLAKGNTREFILFASKDKEDCEKYLKVLAENMNAIGA